MHCTKHDTDNAYKNQVEGRSLAGEVFGEIGVLCNRPQPFTARTRKLSQILRLDSKSFMNIIQTNMEDGYIVMKNFLQKLMGQENINFGDTNTDPGMILKEWLGGGHIGGRWCLHNGYHKHGTAGNKEIVKKTGQAFAGRQPTKVLNRENVEIDDIRDVQDGDHLFLFENGYQTTESNVTRLII